MPIVSREKMPRESTRRGSESGSTLLIPFLLLVGAYCVWVLTLPLFPSLDGSLHLYYASVLGTLLSGSNVFSSYYFIRHILPPYALHYYFLIATAHFFGYVVADKLLVCLIFVVTAFGFRYLARYLGPSGDLLSLLAVSLLLSWPLGMGFYNYSLAIGMALWALGMWYRAVDRQSHTLWVGFLLIVVLMVLTHPVPTLLVYVVIGMDVAWRIASAIRNRNGACFGCRSFLPDLLYMLAAWSTAVYIAVFTGAHRVIGNITQTYPRKPELIALAKLSTLAIFSGSQLSVFAYRLSLYFILFVALWMATRGLKQAWQSGRARAIAILFVCSLALLVIIPLLPPVMNGANYFAQRLVIVAWLGMLAAASGYGGMALRTRRAATVCILIYAVVVLGFANARIRPVAASISQIETGPIYGSYKTGLTLSLPTAPDPTTLNYFPYYWAGTRYFRQTKSTLLNGGWLYESYLPLGSKLQSITDNFPPEIQDSPGNAYRLLLDSKATRERVMPRVNLVVFTGRQIPANLTQIVQTLDDGEPSRIWNCDSASWYSVCTAPFAR